MSVREHCFFTVRLYTPAAAAAAASARRRRAAPPPGVLPPSQGPMSRPISTSIAIRYAAAVAVGLCLNHSSYPRWYLQDAQVTEVELER